MLTTLITLVKIAGASGVLILAWAAFRPVSKREEPVLDSVDPERGADTSAFVLRAFTCMLIFGAVSMLALTMAGIAQDL